MDLTARSQVRTFLSQRRHDVSPVMWRGRDDCDERREVLTFLLFSSRVFLIVQSIQLLTWRRNSCEAGGKRPGKEQKHGEGPDMNLQQQEERGSEPSVNTSFVLPLAAIRRHMLALVGGKGANLGEMTGARLPVPPGFCITTAAYEQVASEAGLEAVLDARAPPRHAHRLSPAHQRAFSPVPHSGAPASPGSAGARGTPRGKIKHTW